MDVTFLQVFAISGLCYNLCVLWDAYKCRALLDNDTEQLAENNE
jgi:hypothetical protein